MRTQLAPKNVKRMLSADGYLDLGMPERAVAELERIDDAGMLEGPRQLLHGIALKQLDSFPEAITHLEKAARLMPSPVRKFAWKELETCYRAVGANDLAELAHKLAGNVEMQLRIALPFSPMTIDLTMTPSASGAES